MILDAAPFAPQTASPARRHILSGLLRLIESRLDVSIVRDRRAMPYSRDDLLAPLRLADALLQSGTIRSFAPVETPCDTLPFKMWHATCATERQSETSGASWQSDADALTAALAEGLERAIWWDADDYFNRPLRASTADMVRGGWPHIAPGRYVAFSSAQRARKPELAFTDETPFQWILGTSLVTGRETYVPAQTVTGLTPAGSTYQNPWGEPLIRNRHTTGLATWPTRPGAQLAGALECIEREAYMIMWLNQLSLPRVGLSALRAAHPRLTPLFEALERYRFKAHFVQLATDAPTHALCCVLEDMSGQAPLFALGLKAHRNLAHAVEKSLLEALRGHEGARKLAARGPWDPSKDTGRIGHYERLQYWAKSDNARKLKFLVSGPEQEISPSPWDTDSEEVHLARVTAWCRANGFECICVPFTASKKNPTAFHVEMTVIPELQPTHLFESGFACGGQRWQTVPRALGLAPRKEMYAEEPHPFV